MEILRSQVLYRMSVPMSCISFWEHYIYTNQSNFGPQGPATFQAEGLRAWPKGPTASGSASAPDMDLHGFTRIYADLHGFTRFYADLRGFTRFYADLRGCTTDLRGSTRIYAVFTRIYVD